MITYEDLVKGQRKLFACILEDNSLIVKVHVSPICLKSGNAGVGRFFMSRDKLEPCLYNLTQIKAMTGQDFLAGIP